jgi:5-formyltetrahydrofolate cyclo-ligase
MAVPPTALDDLRSEMRKRRLSHAKNTVFTACVDLSLQVKANVIGAYRPMRGEPDPAPIAAALDCPTALPFLANAGAAMQFRRWAAEDPLVRASWGGEQPDNRARVETPDLILVPLLAFDAAFNRVGQGGGHYDRYLAAHPSALRIGLAWDFQRVDAIAPQPWDVPLDAVLTERAFYVKDLTRCQRP